MKIDKLLLTAGFSAFFGALAWASPIVAQGPAPAAPPSPKIVIYRGATIIDGTGAPARQNMSIVVRDDRIEAIVPTNDTSALPSNAELVDVVGKFAVPGLIDAHVHLATSPNPVAAIATLYRNIYSGVTAVRDMAGDARLLAELSRRALVGEIPASDIYYAAVMVGPSFFEDPRVLSTTRGLPIGSAAWMQGITDKTDLKIAVARAHGTGASGIKIYGDLSARLVRRIIAEAHRQGIKTWVHGAVFPARPEQVVAAGADVVSHASFVALALAPKLPDLSRDMQNIDMKALLQNYREDDPTLGRLFAEMQRRGEILDATVSTALRAEQRAPGALAVTAAVTRQAYRAGVQIAAGTDVKNADDDPYPPLYRELELLEDQVGMMPMDVIRSATIINAQTIGRAGDMGTIEAGKLANIMFLAADPLQDISNLQTVFLTVKRGTRFARKDYHSGGIGTARPLVNVTSRIENLR